MKEYKSIDDPDVEVINVQVTLNLRQEIARKVLVVSSSREENVSQMILRNGLVAIAAALEMHNHMEHCKEKGIGWEMPTVGQMVERYMLDTPRNRKLASHAGFVSLGLAFEAIKRIAMAGATEGLSERRSQCEK